MDNRKVEMSVILRKLRSGENGEPATSYWIVTSQSSIKRGVNGALTPATVSAVRMKKVGGSTPQATTEYAFIYCEYNSSGMRIRRMSVSNGQNITPSPNAASLNFYMLPTSSSDVSTSIANASISVVNDGENGVGSYAMDLDNENVNIGLTTNGGSLYPATGYNVGESGIYVAAGGNNTATLTKMELLSSAGSVLATATSGSDGSWNSTELGITSLVLKLNSIKATFATSKAHSSGEKIEFKLRGTIQVTDGNGTHSVEAYKVWNILFQPPGADGVSPTVYELQPSNACVVIDPNSGGVRTPSTVSCKVIKHYGDTYEDVTDTLDNEGLKLYAVIDGVENETSSQSVSLAGNLEWLLKKGSTVIDKEVIAFISEGENGDNGAAGVSLVINPSSLIFNENSLSAKSVLVYINRGGVPETPQSVYLAETVENLTAAPGQQMGVGKTLRLLPQSGFNYNGNLSVVVEDNDNNTYLGLISVTMAENNIVPVVTPAYINYTAGSLKTIPMSLQIMDGGLAKTPSAVTIKFNNSAVNSYGGVSWNSSTKTLTFADNATFGSNRSDTITFSLTYKSKTYAVDVPVSRTLNGSRGPSGLIYRKTEWAIGRVYHNDSNEPATDGALRFLDVVYKTRNGHVIGVWECIKSHTSDTNNDPSAEEFLNNESLHWRQCHLYTDPIYTSLILAEGSAIAFMQGNELKIYDTNGNLKAGVSASTGDYPIFYANPQKYPVRVDVNYATTPSTKQDNEVTWLPNSGITSANKLTVPNNQYLHLQFYCYWSDGSETIEHRMNLQNTTGSQLQAASPMPVAFRCTRANNSTEANAASTKYSPCTSVAKPYLWAYVTLGTKGHGWYMIAKQQGGTEDSTRAMFQVKESGDTIMGMPTGARLHLVAAPESGLPRMDIYDEDGNPAAIIDGSTILDSSMLFGDGIPSASIPTGRISVTQSPYMPVQQANTSATINCDREGILTIPAFSVNLTATMGSHPNQNGGIVGVLLMIDGGTTYSHTYTLADGEQLSKTVHFPERSKAVSAGIHDVSLVLHYVYTNGEGLNFLASGTSRGQATIQVTAPITFQVSSSMLRCRYFANGLAIGSANNNYFMAWNEGDKMQFVCENSSVGLRVTSDSVQIKRNGGNWVDL